MSLKIVYLILGITIIVQIAFSFYFSNEIINQNQKYQQGTELINALNQKIEIMENKYTGMTSISSLYNLSTQSGLVPINQTIDLNLTKP